MYVYIVLYNNIVNMTMMMLLLPMMMVIMMVESGLVLLWYGRLARIYIHINITVDGLRNVRIANS